MVMYGASEGGLGGGGVDLWCVEGWEVIYGAWRGGGVIYGAWGWGEW